MKVRMLIIGAVVFSVIFSLPGWSIQNRAVRSPVDSATVPQSSLHNGLVQSPNPINTSGDLLITGNVGGGKHFRGSVPYHSRWDFEGTLNSSTLDSFLRYSSGSGDFGRYLGGYQPFYSDTGTVTTTQPGQLGVLMPPSARTGGLRTSRVMAESVIGKQGLSIVDVDVSKARLTKPGFVGTRPMSRTLPELERMISDDLGTALPQNKRLPAQPREGKLTDEQYQEQMKQLREELLEISEKMKELTEDVAEDGGTAGLTAPGELRVPGEQDAGEELTSGRGTTEATQPQERTSRAPKPASADTATEGSKASKAKSVEEILHDARVKMRLEGRGSGFTEDVQERTKLKAENFVRLDSPDTKRDTTLPETTLSKYAGVGGGSISDYQKHYLGDLAEKRSNLLEKIRALEAAEEGEGLEQQVPVREGPAVIEELRSLSDAEISAKAKDIMGSYESYDAFAKAKYDRYIIAGEMYIKQGRYYRAADSYSIALIYKADDPLAYLGKSHALFAAGEYVSSALFLSRALEARPEYAQGKPVVALCDRDEIDSRIVELNECLEISDLPKLKFLLAYVYYRVGQSEQAKAAINAAYEKMPDSAAVQALKKAIDGAGTSK